MDEKQLRKLKRSQLLEILYAQSKKIEQLEEENEALKDQLSSRALEMKKAGSLAEQAVRITGLFEKAQEAANLYLQNVYRIEGVGTMRQPSQAAQSRTQATPQRQPEASRVQGTKQQETPRQTKPQRPSQPLRKNRRTSVEFLNDDEWD